MSRDYPFLHAHETNAHLCVRNGLDSMKWSHNYCTGYINRLWGLETRLKTPWPRLRDFWAGLGRLSRPPPGDAGVNGLSTRLSTPPPARDRNTGVWLQY